MLDGYRTFGAENTNTPEISDIKCYTSAPVHSGEVTAETLPTCTEKGSKSLTCTKCTKTVTEIIPALGHNCDSVVIQPTCTEGGYTMHTCSRCEYRFIDNPISHLGHN